MVTKKLHINKAHGNRRDFAVLHKLNVEPTIEEEIMHPQDQNDAVYHHRVNISTIKIHTKAKGNFLNCCRDEIGRKLIIIEPSMIGTRTRL